MSIFDSDLPKWVQNKYNILWDAFQETPFTLEEASTILEEKKEAREGVPVFISELRKAGWLNAEFDPKDSRKRIYKLKSKERMITEILSLEHVTKGDLDRLLKNAADLIRTRVDYNFILVLLFLKRVSDKWELEYEETYKEALDDGLTKEDALQEAQKSSYHDFDLPEKFLWNNIRKNVEKLPENFSRAMKKLVELNPELSDVLDNVDFVQFAANKENSEILRQLVELFSAKRLHRVPPDILGNAYEWILRYFAPDKAKEGEVYTPREVIELLVEILDPRPNESVYDPASASNGMLIISYKLVQNRYGHVEADKLFLYGQEVNQKTLALGRMNLYIHDIRNATVKQGDTLLYPKFKDTEGVKKFDVVIANPPWNQDGYEESVLKKGELWKQRFGYGFPPSQSADWAWVQHMLSSTDHKKGRVGIVLDSGCLFRGGKEGIIRAKILGQEKNLNVYNDALECVILLPDKLFYNTDAPGVLLIFKCNKPSERAGKVLFINASREYERHHEVKKLRRLSAINIEKIVNAYHEFKDIPKLSRVVTLEEIKNNGFNLTVSRYIDVSEEDDQINVTQTWRNLKELELSRRTIEGNMEMYLKELGLW